ncbi:transporter substrate-binding domain-containing protein [Pseudomonas sp. dw_358]|uniref:substrate-binding periplasmic protein n=1 Tax=Pseudomonas sp. dw_358 TaxID=2720083 RepID=UPI001BD64682|nr:transporter substrate-binding domain-containing protein [Pseudomonas sp. dw_358]
MPFRRLLLTALSLTILSLPVQAEKLRIVTEPWAPYVYVDSHDQAKGIDYEVTATVFQRLGIDVEWQFLPWKRCLAMLAQGQADGALDIFHTTARDNELLYPAEPLSDVQFMLFQDNRHPHSVSTLDDLAGLTVGTSPGYFYGDAFMNAQTFKQETAPSHEANFGKLIRGRVDLVLTDRRVGEHVIREMGLQDQVSELPVVIYQNKQFLAVRRNAGMDLLIQRFGVELKRFKQEPQYQALLQRYAAAEQRITQAPTTADSRHSAVEQQESGAL